MMASEGPNLPATASVEDTGGTDLGWESTLDANDAPTNITADAGAVNTYDNDGSDENSFWLIGTNYIFSIPSGATIDGFEVELHQIDTQGGTSPDTKVIGLQMVVGGSRTGDDKGDNWEIGSSPTDRTYGGAADLWGLSVDDTDINASTFGVALRVSVNRNDYVSIDTLKITVHYTEGGGGGGSSTVERGFPRAFPRGICRGMS